MGFKFQLLSLVFFLFCRGMASGQNLRFSYHLNDKGSAQNISDFIGQNQLHPRQLLGNFAIHNKLAAGPYKLNNEFYAQHKIQKVIKVFSNETSETQRITEVYDEKGFIKKLYIQEFTGKEKQLDSVSFVYKQNHTVVLRIGNRIGLNKEDRFFHNLQDTVVYYLNPSYQITKIVYNHPCYLDPTKTGANGTYCDFQSYEFTIENNRIVAFSRFIPGWSFDSKAGKAVFRKEKASKIQLKYFERPRQNKITANSGLGIINNGVSDLHEFWIAEIYKDSINRPVSTRHFINFSVSPYLNTILEKVYYSGNSAHVMKRQVFNSWNAISGYDKDTVPATYYPEYSELIYKDNGLLNQVFTVRDYRDPFVLKAQFYEQFDVGFDGRNEREERRRRKKAIRWFNRSLELARKDNELEKYYKRFPALTITYLPREK